MAFYAQMDELYQRRAVFQAAMETGNVRINKLYLSMETLEDTIANAQERNKLQTNIDEAFKQQDELWKRMEAIDLDIAKLDGQREAKEKEAAANEQAA